MWPFLAVYHGSESRVILADLVGQALARTPPSSLSSSRLEKCDFLRQREESWVLLGLSYREGMLVSRCIIKTKKDR